MKTLIPLVMAAALGGCATHPDEICRETPVLFYTAPDILGHTLACAIGLIDFPTTPKEPFRVPSLESIEVKK